MHKPGLFESCVILYAARGNLSPVLQLAQLGSPFLDLAWDALSITSHLLKHIQVVFPPAVFETCDEIVLPEVQPSGAALQFYISQSPSRSCFDAV